MLSIMYILIILRLYFNQWQKTKFYFFLEKVKNHKFLTNDPHSIIYVKILK